MDFHSLSKHPKMVLESQKIESPIKILNKIMSLDSKSIDYKLISVSGELHAVQFVYQAVSANMFAYGKGSSKIEAKHNAASNFLATMGYNNSEILNILRPSINQIKDNKNVLNKIIENPIGLLQELCISYNWVLPNYEVLETIDEFHIVLCSLNNYKHEGKGFTKQQAKKQAAFFMYNNIKDLPQDKITKYHTNENVSPSKVMLNSNIIVNNLEELKIDNHSSKIQKHIDIFFKQLKSSQSVCLNKLKTHWNSIHKFMPSSMDILNVIGKDENFSVIYTIMTNEPLHKDILVQVSTIPILVHIGTGNTVEEAEEAAAYGVLLYIKCRLEV